MVLQQKSPALVIQKAAVDGHQRIVPQGTAHVEHTDDGFLSGAVLAGDHHRGGALTDAADILLTVTDTAGEAENAAVKSVFSFGPGGKADAHLVGRQGRFPGVEEEAV